MGGLEPPIQGNKYARCPWMAGSEAGHGEQRDA